VSLTATVTAGGSGTLDGSVTFKDGSTVLGTATLNDGKASLSTLNLQPGNNSITATYNGNALFNSSTSNAVNVTAARPTPPPPPPSFSQAAETLFLDGIYLVWDQYLHQLNALSGVNASIAANSPYAEPFSPYFVLAGEVAAANALSNSQ
jgi:Bacterial Ig-like domain (group 3)